MFANFFGSLALLASLVVLPVGFIALIVTLAARRRKAAARIGLGLAGWIGVYTTALLLVSFTTPQRVLAMGEEHCFDEMCFSVQNVVPSKTLGAGSQQLTAGGIFYIVTVQLRNDAKRVAQKPSDPGIWIQDQQGRSYTQILGAGDALGQTLDANRLWDQKLQAGESQARTLAFDLPADTANPLLVIAEGGGPTFLIIGDENSPFHTKTAFLLNP